LALDHSFVSGGATPVLAAAAKFHFPAHFLVTRTKQCGFEWLNFPYFEVTFRHQVDTGVTEQSTR